jgi:hypothetical protein
MSQSTVTFSSGCGTSGPPVSETAFRPGGVVRPGTTVSSDKLALARPPQAMNAMFSLLFRFWPRRNAGAAVMTAVAATVCPTNLRRVMGFGDVNFAGDFMGLPSTDNSLSRTSLVSRTEVELPEQDTDRAAGLCFEAE